MCDLRQVSRLPFETEQVIKQTVAILPQLSFLGTFDFITIGGTIIALIFCFEKSQQDSLRVDLKDHCKKQSVNQSLSEICLSDMLSITSEQANKYKQLYTCPISYELMQDPVMANCSKCTIKRNYERNRIEQHISNYFNCPFCKQMLSRSQLITNQVLRESIKLFKQQIRKKMVKYQQKRIKNDGLD